MNMKYKLFLVLVIFIFSVSAVSAETDDVIMDSTEIDYDVTVNNLDIDQSSNSEGKAIVLNSNEDSLNFADLNNTISDTSSGGIIDLTGDVVKQDNEFSTFSDGITINKNLTINGNGYVIDASGMDVYLMLLLMFA